MTESKRDETPDEMWMDAALRGDRSAAAELALRWYRRTLAFCHARLPQMSDAEDATQETLTRAFQHLHELRDPHQFAPWLRGIATHVCHDFWRRRHRNASACGDWNDVLQKRAPESLDEQLEGEEDRAEVWRAIGRLDERLREVILLHYYERLTYDQMARWLGVARATVQERLSKARRQLRYQLADRIQPPR